MTGPAIASIVGTTTIIVPNIHSGIVAKDMAGVSG
jgi:hypothetical protein